jgi:hypothetical protein
MLDSQLAELNAVLSDLGLLSQVTIEKFAQNNSHILRLKNETDKAFTIGGDAGLYELNMSPGPAQALSVTQTQDWNGVLETVRTWAGYVKRERMARERLEYGGVPQRPDWLSSELPPEYQKALDQISALQATADAELRLAELLWQTGEPLNRRVIAAFNDLGFKTEGTAPGETYDVTVILPTGRLLIEVTGLEGQVKKASGKISQLFQVQQSELQAGDRACLAINAFRDKPINQRTDNILTADALNLVIMLQSIAFSTVDLYRLVMTARSNPNRTREIVEGLLTAPAGIATLT